MTETTARIEVRSSDLLRLIADAKSFASKDDTIPTINGIVFEFAGEDLLAVGTDRYTLGVARLPIGQAIVQPNRVLRLDDVSRLEKAFRPARGSDPTLAVEFGDEGVAVETTATLDGQPTHREAFPWSSYTPLAWRSIIDPLRDVESGPVVAGFNPAFLAKFVAVQHSDAESVLVWPTYQNKPWRVTVGDRFTGLIMPVRAEIAEWVPSAINEAPAAKPRASRASKKAAA